MAFLPALAAGVAGATVAGGAVAATKNRDDIVEKVKALFSDTEQSMDQDKTANTTDPLADKKD